MKRAAAATEPFLILRRRKLADGQDVVDGLASISGRLSAVIRKGSVNVSWEAPSLVSLQLRPPRMPDGLYRGGQGDLAYPFLVLRSDLAKLSAAGFFSRLFWASLAPGEGGGDEFRLLLYLLESLERTDSIRMVGLWGQARFLDVLGVGPELDACVGCGASELRGFSPAAGGVVCEPCLGRSGAVAYRVPISALLFCRQLRELPLEEQAGDWDESIFRMSGRILRDVYLAQLSLRKDLFRPVLSPRRSS